MIRCECETCKGTGDCRDCDGSGTRSMLIQFAILNPKSPGYADLCKLREDALRCIKQAELLIKANPPAEHSYRKQLRATLDKINDEAEALQKTKT